jgi:hypothetical protein
MSNFNQQELDIILPSINNIEKLVHYLKCQGYSTSKINEGIVLSKLLYIFNIKYLEVTTEERPDFIIKTQLGNIFELEVVSIGCDNTLNEVKRRIIEELEEQAVKQSININISKDWTIYVSEDVNKESEIKLIIQICCEEIELILNEEILEEESTLRVMLFLNFMHKKVKNNFKKFKEINRAKEVIETLKVIKSLIKSSSKIIKESILPVILNIRNNHLYQQNYSDLSFQGQEYENNKGQILNSIKNKFKKYKEQKLSGQNATGVLGIKCGNHFQSILTNETHEYALKLVKEINEDKDNMFKNHCYFSYILIVGNSCKKNYYLIRYQKENEIWSLIYQ